MCLELGDSDNVQYWVQFCPSSALTLSVYSLLPFPHCLPFLPLTEDDAIYPGLTSYLNHQQWDHLNSAMNRDPGPQEFRPCKTNNNKWMFGLMVMVVGSKTGLSFTPNSSTLWSQHSISNPSPFYARVEMVEREGWLHFSLVQGWKR